MKWLLFWVQKVVTTETCQSKTLFFAKGKLAVSNNSYKIKEIIFDALHFTIMVAEGVPKAKFTKLKGQLKYGFCKKLLRYKWSKFLQNPYLNLETKMSSRNFSQKTNETHLG